MRKYGGEISFRAQLEQAISGGFFASKTATHINNQGASLTGAPSLRPEQSGQYEIESFLFDKHFSFYSDPVPVVLLVVEGGPNTVRTGIKECYLF